jgi:hypothetical protein
VFLLALDYTTVAADTFDQIYQHTPSHVADLAFWFLYALTLGVGSDEPERGQKRC